MMHFENYQWQDHVPRKGSWKLNLAIGVLALGLIGAAMPHRSGDLAPTMWTSTKPSPEANVFALEGRGQFTPAAFTGNSGEQADCPNTYADS